MLAKYITFYLALFASLSTLNLNAQSTKLNQIMLNPLQLKQKIDLAGGDMERSANFLRSASNSDQIIQWYFKDIKMPFWRVVIDKHQELEEGQTNYGFYQQQIEVMQKIRAVDPEVVFWATLKTDYDGYGDNNNMPDWVYTGGGYNGGDYDPTAFNAKKWARFLADYLKLMHDNDVAIEIISVSKEWMQVMPAINEIKTIRHLMHLLQTPAYTGVPIPKFNGPAAWGVKQAKNFVNAVAQHGAQNLYAGFSAHTYDRPSQEDWIALLNAAKPLGLPVYNEESNSAGGGPFHGEHPPFKNVTAIYSGKAEAYQAGLSGELFFELWSRGFNRESRSVYFKRGQAGKRGRGYWLSKLFINQVYNKHYIASSIATNLADDIKVMAFSNKRSVVLYVINRSLKNSYSNIALTLGKDTRIQGTIQQTLWHQKTPWQGMQADLPPQTSSSFRLDSKANSLAVYQFKITP